MKTLTGWEEIIVSEALKQYKKSIIEHIERNEKTFEYQTDNSIIYGLKGVNEYLAVKLKDVDSLISKLEEQ